MTPKQQAIHNKKMFVLGEAIRRNPKQDPQTLVRACGLPLATVKYELRRQGYGA